MFAAVVAEKRVMRGGRRAATLHVPPRVTSALITSTHLSLRARAAVPHTLSS